MVMRVLILALLAAFIFPAPVFAQEKEPPLPAPLAQQRQLGAQIFYLGKHESMDGWVMVRAGQPEFYYATPDGKSIVLGILFDGEGKMVTPGQMAALQQSRKDNLLSMVQPDRNAVPMPAGEPVQAAPAVPLPASEIPANTSPAVDPAAPSIGTATLPMLDAGTSSPSERLLAAMKDVPSLHWGSQGAPGFYVFLDPDCTHCQRFIREVEPFVLAGRVAVHMVMVGRNEDSLRRAAFVLAAGDGVDRLVRYAKGETAAVPADQIDTTAVMNNLKLMHAWSLTSTPTLLYRAASDQKIRMIRGRPYDVGATVADMSPAP